jgi:hypothetical protein
LSCCPYVHIYKTPLAATAWNAMRNGRIMLHWMITETLRRHVDHTYGLFDATQLANMSETSIRLQIDTLATVQQHLDTTLGFMSAPTLTEDRPSAMSSTCWSSEAVLPDSGQHKLPVLRTTGGNNLLWHLAFIADKGSPTHRPSARKMIKAIGTTLGIRQAFAVLEALGDSVNNT